MGASGSLPPPKFSDSTLAGGLAGPGAAGSPSGLAESTPLSAPRTRAERGAGAQMAWASPGSRLQVGALRAAESASLSTGPGRALRGVCPAGQAFWRLVPVWIYYL